MALINGTFTLCPRSFSQARSFESQVILPAIPRVGAKHDRDFFYVRLLCLTRAFPSMPWANPSPQPDLPDKRKHSARVQRHARRCCWPDRSFTAAKHWREPARPQVSGEETFVLQTRGFCPACTGSASADLLTCCCSALL